MMRSHNLDAVRGSISAFARGTMSAAQLQDVLLKAGWQQSSITRLLQSAEKNLKLEG